jgi:hypothetical protein
VIAFDHRGIGASSGAPVTSMEQMAKDATVTVLQAQLKALRRWGSKAPADLSKIHQPVLVANGDSDRKAPPR